LEGWIKLHRAIKKHWIVENSEYFKWWILLLLDVNHSDKKFLWNGELIEVKRGQKITSLKKLADEYNCSREKIRHFLKLLEKDSMITLESHTKYTQLTICKYDSYQVEQHTENTQKTQQKHTDNTTSDTNKNDKKEKKEKNLNNTLLSELKSSDFEDSKYYEITISFYELFKKNLIENGAQTTTLEKAKGSWINHIRLLIEKDKYTIEDLRKVFEYLQKDDFWKQNILSTSKLREQFDKLIIKANATAKEIKGHSKGATDAELAGVLYKHFGDQSQEQ
jgi:DNA-binding transcriptional regulator YhcF (GntR family)